MTDGDRAMGRGRVSSTDAAFAGFALVREHPELFVALMILALVLGIVSSALQVVVAGPAVTRLMELQLASANGGPRPDPAVLVPLMGPIWEMNLILLPLIVLFYAVSNAAVYRAMLTPTAGGFGYLRLGAAELRQVGMLVLFGLLMIGVIIVAEIAAVILGVVAAIVLATTANGALSHGVLAAIMAMLVILCLTVPVLLSSVRLSLAGPMTFVQRRVRLTGSWPLTRGRFWGMFGAYVLAGVVMIVVAILFLVIGCAVAAMLDGTAGVRALFLPNSASLGAYFTPGRVVFLLLNAPMSALWIVVQAAVPAALYKQIVGEPSAAPSGFDRSHSFGTPSAPNPPQGEFPITPPSAKLPPDAL